jgi:hypothetical protein
MTAALPHVPAGAWDSVYFLPSNPNEFRLGTVFASFLRFPYRTLRGMMATESSAFKKACRWFTDIVLFLNPATGKWTVFFFGTKSEKRVGDDIPHKIVGHDDAPPKPIVLDGAEIPLPSCRPKKLLSVKASSGKLPGDAVLLHTARSGMCVYLVDLNAHNATTHARGMPLDVIADPSDDHLGRLCSVNLRRANTEDINDLLLAVAEKLATHGCSTFITGTTIRVLLPEKLTLDVRRAFEAAVATVAGDRPAFFFYDKPPPRTEDEERHATFVRERRQAERRELRQAATAAELDASQYGTITTTHLTQLIDMPLLRSLAGPLGIVLGDAAEQIEPQCAVVKFFDADMVKRAAAKSALGQLGPFRVTPCLV